MQSVGAKTLLMGLKNNRESGIQEMEFLVSLPICMHVCNIVICILGMYRIRIPVSGIR